MSGVGWFRRFSQYCVLGLEKGRKDSHHKVRSCRGLTASTDTMLRAGSIVCISWEGAILRLPGNSHRKLTAYMRTYHSITWCQTECGAVPVICWELEDSEKPSRGSAITWLSAVSTLPVSVPSADYRKAPFPRLVPCPWFSLL